MLPNDLLYKYKQGNENDFDSIENDYLWISNVKKLNDPFDSTFRVDLDSLYKSYLITGIANNRLNSVKGKERFKKMINNYKENFKKSSFVGALTEDYENMMMWDKYADGNKGICLAYDIQDLVFAINNFIKSELKSKTALIEPVFYCEDVLSVNNMIELQRSYRCYAMKKMEWCSEKEWRIIITTLGKYEDNAFKKYAVPEKEGLILHGITPKKIYIGYQDSCKLEKLKPICKEKYIELYKSDLCNDEIVYERIV